MKALCWNGINNIGVETVHDPDIINPKDAIIKVCMSSVSGADLYLIDGIIPSMKKGDILGNEFLGEVVEIGREVQTLKRGDRVVVSSVIGCGGCYYCQTGAWSLCDNSNPNAWIEERMFGSTTAGILGYSHAFGGYAGSHANYIRIPFADKGAFKIPDEVSDEKAIFCSSAFPTAYMAAEMCEIKTGDVVAIWGCGAAGLLAIECAQKFGAGKIIAIDNIEERLNVAKNKYNAIVLNFSEIKVSEALTELTGGRGPDKCIDAVGAEKEKQSNNPLDRARKVLKSQDHRTEVLKQMIVTCRKGGILSVTGTYTGDMNSFPLGAATAKSLTLKMGQVNPQKYIPTILNKIAKNETDPSFLLTHKFPLQKGHEGYELFRNKTDNCLRVVFTP